MGIQDQWRQIQADWPSIRQMMALAIPDRDWLRPVNLMPSDIDTARLRAAQIVEADRREYQTNTVRSAAAMGTETFLAVLVQQGSTTLPEGDGINRFLERERLAMLEAFRPVRERLNPVTARQAMIAYLAYHEGRTRLKAGDWIVDSRCWLIVTTLLAVPQTLSYR